eukprot:1247880-Pleurochrysis_carterae.AAC.4
MFAYLRVCASAVNSVCACECARVRTCAHASACACACACACALAYVLACAPTCVRACVCTCVALVYALASSRACVCRRIWRVVAPGISPPSREGEHLPSDAHQPQPGRRDRTKAGIASGPELSFSALAWKLGQRERSEQCAETFVGNVAKKAGVGEQKFF